MAGEHWGRQGSSTTGVRGVGRPPSGVSVVSCPNRAPWQGGLVWGARLPRTRQRRGLSVQRRGKTRLCLVPWSTGVRSVWRQGWSTSLWHRRASPAWSVSRVARGGGLGVSVPPSHRLAPAREASPRWPVCPRSRHGPWLGGLWRWPRRVRRVVAWSDGGPTGCCWRQPVRRPPLPPSRRRRRSRAAGAHTARRAERGSLRADAGRNRVDTTDAPPACAGGGVAQSLCGVCLYTCPVCALGFPQEVAPWGQRGPVRPGGGGAAAYASS